jgi:hypothetical protein
MQGQSGDQALKAIHSANKAFAQAMTASTVKPRVDEVTNKFIYGDPSTAPRVLALQVFVNQVQETPMPGGTLPPCQLHRENVHISYISSSKEGTKRIFKILAVDSQINRDNYE